MQITSFLLGRILSQENKKEKQLFQLSENENACYDRIVTDLLLCCNERGVGLSMESRQAYAIVFQQSYSWRKIETELSGINTSIINEAVQEMTASWKKHITKLRSLQNDICDYTNLIPKYKKQANDIPKKHNDSPLLKEYRKKAGLSKKLAKEKIAANRYEIQECFKKAFNDRNAQLENPQIIKYKPCKDLLKRLVMHWQQLWVFFDHPEVSIDENKLCVKICNSSSSKNYQVSMATKAIFTIEEQELKETIVVVPGNRGNTGKITGKRLRPKRVSLKKKCFAPATPSPGKRVPSSVELTNGVIFDFAFTKEDNLKAVTSLAARLEYMVQRAIERVNEELSKRVNEELSTGSTDAPLSDPDSDDDSSPFQEEDFSPPTHFNRFLLSLTPLFYPPRKT